MKREIIVLLVLSLLFVGCHPKSEGSKDKGQTEEVYACSDTVLHNQGPVLGERIDGPANLRDSINGKVLLSIADNQNVECSPLTHDWYRVGLVIPITKEQYLSYILPKGEKIYHQGEWVCTVMEDIELWMTEAGNSSDTCSQYVGILGGYTYKSNIKPASIPEKELEKILNAGGTLSKEKFACYFWNFAFEAGGLPIKGHNKAEQYMIYGTWIDDPSPIDRIRLVFEEQELIAVIHELPLHMDGKESYPLVRGMQLLVIKDMDTETLQQFIASNQESYRGVD